MNRKRLFFYALILAAGLVFSVCAEEIALEIPAEEILVGFHTQGDPAEGYIYQKLYPQKKTMFRAPRPSGSSLTDANRVLYEYLKIKAAAFAAGTENCTIVNIPAGEVYEKVSYTAEDLGVSVIVENGAFTKEAAEVILGILKNSFDLSTVFRCLLADCPYEMYWYDKTVGSYLSYPRTKYSIIDDRETVFLDGNVTLYIPVSTDYRDTGYEQIKGRYCYIDTSWGQSVDQAIANARAIVDAYEELEDYDRLKAYKEEIRTLTEYNGDAAVGDVDYGNPWQLVWVFDGDPETKVVCEGFAKAFQYLNDLSAGSATVISVTGKMDGLGHMWNIVRMDDEQNYLADITNCYTDQNGNEFLFMDGYQDDLGDGTYVYRWKDTTVTYTYDGDNGIHNADDLVTAAVGYLDAKPAIPVFIAEEGAENFLIGEPVGFSYQENPDVNYDGFLVKVTFFPDDGGEKTVTRKQALLSTEGIWEFGSEFHEAGIYQVQFAGKRESFTSLWSEAVQLTPEVLLDLGHIGFTEEILAALEAGFDAGDEQALEWEASEYAAGYRILIQEQGDDGETPYDGSFFADETETVISWAVCPGSYTLSFLPEMEAGYAYSTDSFLTVQVRDSGRAWTADENGTLTRYFGSESEVTVPEMLDGTEIVRIGAEAFAHSKARSVEVPSFIGADPGAFQGNGKLTAIYGYTNSEAETAAQEAEIPFFSMGVKPGIPVCVLSSETGYTGYTLIIRLNEEADSVRIRETGKETACCGRDVLIPLTEAGTAEYTLAAITDGIRGDYGETVSCTVYSSGQDILFLPGQIRMIQEEAFSGTAASVIMLPDTVETIGEMAFAGSGALQVVELEGDETIADNVFYGCDHPVFCVLNYHEWFEKGIDFLTKQEETEERE